MLGKITALGALLILSQSAVADQQQCIKVATEKVKECQESASALVSTLDSGDQQIAQESLDNGDGIRDPGSLLNSSANNQYAGWTQLKTICEQKRERCAEACQGQESQDIRFECFSRINKVIQQADRGIASAQGTASQAASSGNQARADGAEEIEGNVHQVATPGSVGPGYAYKGANGEYCAVVSAGSAGCRVSINGARPVIVPWSAIPGK